MSGDLVEKKMRALVEEMAALGKKAGTKELQAAYGTLEILCRNALARWRLSSETQQWGQNPMQHLSNLSGSIKALEKSSAAMMLPEAEAIEVITRRLRSEKKII